MGNSFNCLNESEWISLNDDDDKEDNSYKRAVYTANTTRSIMSDNSDCLNERGEKLSAIEEKSDVLVIKTNEFTSLAKQLKLKMEEKKKMHKQGSNRRITPFSNHQ